MYLSPYLSDNAGTANADLYTDQDVKNEIKRLRALLLKRKQERASRQLREWRATHGPGYNFSRAPVLNGLR